MADESVIFEIQVEKKILEQVFAENKHLKDSYEKLVEGGDVIKTLKEELATSKKEAEDLQQLTKKLNEENNCLKTNLRNEKADKSKIEEKFENERKLLEKISRDKNKLQQAEEEINQLRENVSNLTEEVKKTKELLAKIEAENYQLDIDNLNLEQQVKNLTKTVRLEEEGSKTNDLTQVECKLLKLKLQTIENEKKYLLNDIEKERKIMNKQNKPRVAKLEENIKLLRRWIEKEAKERRPRDTQEVKLLKAQIQTLENDKIDLIEGFELERKVFRKILKTNATYNLP